MKRKQPLARRREKGREREEKQMKRLSEGNESDRERVGHPRGWEGELDTQGEASGKHSRAFS